MFLLPLLQLRLPQRLKSRKSNAQIETNHAVNGPEKNRLNYFYCRTRKAGPGDLMNNLLKL